MVVILISAGHVAAFEARIGYKAIFAIIDKQDRDIVIGYVQGCRASGEAGGGPACTARGWTQGGR